MRYFDKIIPSPKTKSRPLIPRLTPMLVRATGAIRINIDMAPNPIDIQPTNGKMLLSLAPADRSAYLRRQLIGGGVRASESLEMT